jgi:hypothetical protein
MGARPAADRDTVVMARLGRTLLRGQDAAMRAGAARRLGERGLVSAYAWLRNALWDPSEAVRESAVDAIAALAVVQSAGELAALYAWSGPRLRREVMRAVRRIGSTADFAGMLFLAAGDPDREVRALAARAGRQKGWNNRATSLGATGTARERPPECRNCATPPGAAGSARERPRSRGPGQRRA